MIFHRQNGQCTGRGFYNSNPIAPYGFLANFKTWVAQAYPSGPGWTIIDDQSMDVGCEKWGKLTTDFIGPNFDTLAEVVTITNGSFRITIGTTSANVTGLNFSAVTTWDGVASVIQTGLQGASGDAGFTGAICNQILNRTGDPATLARKFVIVAGIRGVDVSVMSTATASVGTDISGYFYLRGNSGTLVSGTNSPFIVICSASSPNWYDDPPNKYIQIGQDTNSGYINIATYLNWNATIHVGFCLWQNNRLYTEDSLPFIYDFRGGNQAMIIQSFKSSTWYSYVIDKWVGDPVLLEAASIKGVTVTARDTTNNSITLTSGQGASFTEGNYYYLIDLNNSESIQYMKIATGGISGDTITFTTNLIMFAGVGAILSPYYHRYYATSTDSYASYACRIHYKSEQARETGLVNDGYYDKNRATGDILSTYLLTMAPNDTTSYACMKPGIVEEPAQYTSGNRAYGSCMNIYATSLSGMSPATDGRTVNGKNYLFFKTHSNLFNGRSDIAILVPDYDESSL